MIQFTADAKDISVKFNGSKNFEEIVQTLKLASCKFNPDEKDWTVPINKYDGLREKLSDLDIISISFLDEKKINELMLKVGKQQTVFERRSFKQELLKKEPVKGIHPNEDYQKQDIIKGITRNRYLLDLDMGLGKSYILSGILTHLQHYDDLGKVLYITTRSGTYNFYHELLKFTNFKEDDIIIGSKDTTDIFEQNKKIIILDFDTFRLLSDKYYKKIYKKSGVKYRKTPIPIDAWIGDKKACLILDESHCVGNPSSRRYSTIKLISDRFYFRYLSTGTFADKIEKIYSQLNILDPGLVHNFSYTDWLAEYASIGNRFSAYAVNYFKKDKIDALMAIIKKSYSSHRRTFDHIELPENNIQTVYVRMSEKHRDIYEKFVKYEMSEMSDMRNIQNKFAYLSLSIDNPKFLLNHEEKLPNDINKLVSKFKVDDLEKFVACDDLVDQYVVDNGEKIIIWTTHPLTANLLKERYAKHSPMVINGEIEVPKGMTKDEYKRVLVEQFKNDKKSKILIASILVLNSAVTMTFVKTQIYFEKNFNFIDYSQSLKRIHRISQTENVTTLNLVYDHSLDLYIMKNLESKGLLNEKLLSKEFLTSEDWTLIFNGNEDDEY